jgi:hypothetical protein
MSQVVTPGSQLRCPVVPGVGANYTFTVAVDGGLSTTHPGASNLLSYAAPLVNDVVGVGALQGTTGGVVVRLVGANFGPATQALEGLDGSNEPVWLNTTVVAAASPTTLSSLVFPGRDCVIVEDHQVRGGGGGGGAWWIGVGARIALYAAATPATTRTLSHAHPPPFITTTITTRGPSRMLIRPPPPSPLSPIPPPSPPAHPPTPLAISTTTRPPSHVAQVIECVTGPAIGADLSWKVEVEGQSSAVPLSHVQGPQLTAVTFAAPGVTAAEPRGGTLLRVTGVNLGFSVEYFSLVVWAGRPARDGAFSPAQVLSYVCARAYSCACTCDASCLRVCWCACVYVSLWLPCSLRVATLVRPPPPPPPVCPSAGVPAARLQALQTTNCAMAEPHTEVVCVLPAGTGALLELETSVLGQTHLLRPEAPLAFAPPTLHAVTPASVDTSVEGTTFTVAGAGFGTVPGVVGVVVRAEASALGHAAYGVSCPPPPATVLATTAVSVFDNGGSLAFTVQVR